MAVINTTVLHSKRVLSADHRTGLVALLFDLGHNEVFVLEFAAAVAAVVALGLAQLGQGLLVERQHRLHLVGSPRLYVLVLLVFLEVLFVLCLL